MMSLKWSRMQCQESHDYKKSDIVSATFFQNAFVEDRLAT